MKTVIAFFTALITVTIIMVAPGCGSEVECSADEVDCDGTCITKIEPTIEAVTESVLAKSCAQSVCHPSSSSAQEGLSLKDVTAVREAINKASQQKPNVMLIKPGDAANSYLVNKMRGENMSPVSSTGKAAGIMPPNNPLCEPKIKAVEDWINAGAN